MIFDKSMNVGGQSGLGYRCPVFLKINLKKFGI
jgi:hypothetical protein